MQHHQHGLGRGNGLFNRGDESTAGELHGAHLIHNDEVAIDSIFDCPRTDLIQVVEMDAVLAQLRPFALLIGQDAHRAGCKVQQLKSDAPVLVPLIPGQHASHPDAFGRNLLHQGRLAGLPQGFRSPRF